MLQLLFTLMALVPGADAPVYPDKLNVMVYQDGQGDFHEIKTADDLAVRRAHTLANMEKVMGPVPERSNLPPFDVEVVETVDMGSYVRKKILFTVEEGDRLPAYLCVPKSKEGERKEKKEGQPQQVPGTVPGVLCLHQTVAIGKAETVGIGTTVNRNYGEELAGRGYVTLAPDYPGFGDYKIDVYAMGYQSATAKGIFNHMRCVDLLQSLPEVHPKRIGCIGHSLGGHNTLFVGAFDERIKVMATSCGFTRFHKYYGGDLTGWSHKGYMPRIAEVYEKSPDKMPFDFPEILAAIAPRSVFVNAPLGDENFEVSGVIDCVNALMPLYGLLDERENLLAVYPDCDHDFPPQSRDLAYQYFDVNFRFPEVREPGHDLRVGHAFHAFEHLGGFDHQGEVAAACGATITYGTGIGGLAYSGLPAPDELARTVAAEREYNERIRKAGIKTCLGYLCATSIVGLEAFDKNWSPEFRAKLKTPPSEWLQQGRDGQPLKSWYGGEYEPACMNNPDWRKYQRAMTKLQFECGHNGIFFDNPTVHADGCYCAHCMDSFAAFLAGKNVEVADVSLDAMRKLAVERKTDFMRFRSTIAASFFSEMRAYARILDRNALLTANNSLNHPSVFYSQSRGLGYNIFEMSRVEDFVVVEDMSTQPRVTEDGKAIEYGPMYRMTHAISHGKPLVACTIIDGDYHTAPNLVRLAMAEAAAHDASYMLWSTWPEDQRQRMVAGVRPQADWLQEHAKVFEKSAPRRDVSVFLPFRRWTETEKCAVSDIAGELTRRNVQYGVFCEEDFAQGVQGARAVVVEDPAVLLESEKEALAEFVKGGGKALCANEAGWLEEIEASVAVRDAAHVRAVARDGGASTWVFLYNLNVRRVSSFEDAVTPAENVKVEVKVPWEKVAKVTVSSADKGGTSGAAAFSVEGDRVTVTVPKLGISALLEIAGAS